VITVTVNLELIEEPTTETLTALAHAVQRLFPGARAAILAKRQRWDINGILQAPLPEGPPAESAPATVA